MDWRWTIIWGFLGLGKSDHSDEEPEDESRCDICLAQVIGRSEAWWDKRERVSPQLGMLSAFPHSQAVQGFRGSPSVP
jgi:hypothetical protein